MGDIRRHRRRARTTIALAVGLAIGLAGCSMSEPPRNQGSGGTADAELVLIGAPSFSFEDFALDVEDLGYEVSGDTAVSSDTDLVLVVVDVQDGPMPQTREAVEALAGSVVPRLAIALVDVDKQTDPEIETLVVGETIEMLAWYGLTPVDSENIVRSPASEIALHLRRPPRDYRPVIPAEPVPPTGPVSVDNFAGVPMADALAILASEGLAGQVLADPDFGVVSECDPLARRLGDRPVPWVGEPPPGRTPFRAHS